MHNPEINVVNIEDVSKKMTDDDIQIVFSIVLRRLIKKHHKSEKEFCLAIGFPVQTVNHWTCDIRNIQDLTRVIKIARHFNVSVEYMLTGEQSDREKAIEEREKRAAEIERKAIEDSLQIDWEKEMMANEKEKIAKEREDLEKDKEEVRAAKVLYMNNDEGSNSLSVS